MDPERRKVRQKRYRNRMRIGITLLSIWLLVAIVSYFITGRFVVFTGFIFFVGIVYLIAGLWERKELKKDA